MLARAITALLLSVVVVAAPSPVRAQAEGPAASAIEIFEEMCLATDAVRADIVERATSDEWTPSTYGSLPTTDNARRGPDVVNLVGGEPEETLVFTKIVAGKPMFIHVFTRAREEGGRPFRAPACNVMVVGVTRGEFARALLSNETERSAFMAMPLVRLASDGRVFVALWSDIDRQHSTAPFGALAMLSFEGAEEQEA